MDGPSLIGFVEAFFLFRGGSRFGRSDQVSSFAFFGQCIIVEQQRRQRLSHVPFDVVNEHTQEDMGANALTDAVVDRADKKVDAFEGAEGLLHVS